MNTKKPDVVLLVQYQVKPGEEEHAERELAELTSKVTQEASCVEIYFQQDQQDPRKFMLFELWADQKVFDEEHSKTPYLISFFERSKGYTVEPMSLQKFRMVERTPGPMVALNR